MAITFVLPELLRAERAGRALALAARADAVIRAGTSLAGAAALAAARHLCNCGHRVAIEIEDLGIHSHAAFATMLEVAGCMDLPLRQAGATASTPADAILLIGSDYPTQGFVGKRRAPGARVLDARDFLATNRLAWDEYRLVFDTGHNPLVREAPSASALPVARVREVDRAAMEDFGLPGLCLMENAGIGATVAAAALLQRGAHAGRPARVAVVVGFGNNGGDGLVAARGLCEFGAEVRVLLLGDPERLRGDARANYEILVQRPELPVTVRDHRDNLREHLRGVDLVIDAVFGTGLARPVTGPPAEAIAAMNACGAPLLALDLPSGLHADTGATPGICARATATVTFAAPKPGIYRERGPEMAGRVLLADIGAPRSLLS